MLLSNGQAQGISLHLRLHIQSLLIACRSHVAVLSLRLLNSCHSFEWLIPPTTGHVGAVQCIEESFGDVSAPPIEIRWEDANGAAAEYDHVLLASSTMGGVPAANLMHEYEEASFGTRLHSHFHFPPGAPEGLIKALYQHNREEMRNFSTFLPALYRSEMGGS